MVLVLVKPGMRPFLVTQALEATTSHDTSGSCVSSLLGCRPWHCLLSSSARPHPCVRLSVGLTTTRLTWERDSESSPNFQSVFLSQPPQLRISGCECGRRRRNAGGLFASYPCYDCTCTTKYYYTYVRMTMVSPQPLFCSIFLCFVLFCFILLCLAQNTSSAHTYPFPISPGCGCGRHLTEEFVMQLRRLASAQPISSVLRCFVISEIGWSGHMGSMFINAPFHFLGSKRSCRGRISSD